VAKKKKKKKKIWKKKEKKTVKKCVICTGYLLLIEVFALLISRAGTNDCFEITLMK
jgi:hypothetical protein